MNTLIHIQLLRYMAKGHKLTALKALRLFNCLSLSQRIGELKRELWPIKSQLVKRNGKHISEYWYERPKRGML
jgi:hypothetical protein